MVSLHSGQCGLIQSLVGKGSFLLIKFLTFVPAVSKILILILEFEQSWLILSFRAEANFPPRNIMVNEALRRMRNTAAELGPALQNQHLNQFMLKLKDSGYSEAFRVSVVKQAKEIYTKQLEQDRLGVKPLFRRRDQILKDKKAKSESGQKWWSKGSQKYNTVLFVPPSP